MACTRTLLYGLPSMAERFALRALQIGAVAALREVSIVPALPKTRSGKILRRTMRGIADGMDEPVPSTIDDPGVLDVVAFMLRREDRKERLRNAVLQAVADLFRDEQARTKERRACDPRALRRLLRFTFHANVEILRRRIGADCRQQ